VVDKKPCQDFDLEAYQQWWRTKGSEFLARHGMHTLMAWTGHPVVGRVLNLSDLEQICARPYLELQSLWVRS